MTIEGLKYAEDATGKDVAVDNVSETRYQVVKLALGAVSEASLIDNGQQTEANSIPVVLPASQISALTPPAAITGYATSVKQDTIIGHVDGIESILTTIDADTGNIATSASSIDTKLSSQATATKQDTGNTSLASIDTKITACDTGGVVVSSSALPSGAATEATLALIKAKTDNLDVALSNLTTPSDQQHVIIDSSATITADTELPTAVTLADGTSNPTTTSVGTFAHGFNGSTWDRLKSADGNLVQATGAITGNASVTSATTLFSLDLLNYSSISVQITNAGTTCTITYEGSNDNASWMSVLMDNISVISSTPTTTSTTTGVRIQNLGTRYFRARVSTYTSGTVAVYYHASSSIFKGVAFCANLGSQTLPILTGSGIAHDAVDSGNPHKIGAMARTTNPTAVADADRTNLIADKLGKLITVCAIRDRKGKQHTAITSSTSETTIVTAGGAGVFRDIYALMIANTSATDCTVTIKESTAGTTTHIFIVKAGAEVGFSHDCGSAVVQTTAANNWTATCSASVASIYITAHYVENL